MIALFFDGAGLLVALATALEIAIGVLEKKSTRHRRV
jgi:hypothetical protein